MNKLIFYIFLIIAISFTSCSKDGCSDSDWIGSYNRVSTDCGVDPFFDESFILSYGACDNCVSFEPTESLEIGENCSIVQSSKVYGDVIMTFSDDVIMVSVPLISCSATYEKE